MLKLTPALGFCLYHCNNLVTGLHQFGLGQHTSIAWKVLKACVGHHQIIAGSGDAPYIADAATLTVSDCVSLPYTLAMAQGNHQQLLLVLVTLFGPYHPIKLETKEANKGIM